jgi:transposase
VNSLGIDVGKKKCRAALKDERGDIIREFFFSNNNEGISALIQSASHYGKCAAVVESTGGNIAAFCIFQTSSLHLQIKVQFRTYKT